MADATEAQDLSPRLQAVRAPIAEGNPVGEDVKYEDSFQQLKAEVDKVQSAVAGADFERIVELGTEVLAEKSKDLTAAAYLGLGLVHTDGLGGLAEGADVLRILCETYWEDMYPPLRRMVARKNALQLLIDRAHDWLEAYKPKSGDDVTLQRALDAYKTVQALAMERMAEDAPVLSKITRLLEEKIRTVPKSALPPQQAAPAPAAAPSGDGAPAAAPPVPAAPSTPDGFRSPTEAAQTVTAAATFLHTAEKTDPAPFRLMRALHWGGLVGPPPAEDGQTLIPPFVPQRKEYLDGLLGRGQFAELVDEAEDTFREQPFWLDLQRYLVTAMDALGAPFAPARDAVIEEAVGLVRRFPDLPALAFNDGTPFADVATQEWIATRIRPALGGGGGEAPAASGAEGSAVDADYAEARERLAQGDLDAAVAALRDGTDAAGRDRFRRRFYLATLCARGGRPAVARPILEALAAEVEAHGLAAWEPALTLDVWAALHGCYDALRRGADEDGQAALLRASTEVFGRIAALDPARALALLGTGKR